MRTKILFLLIASLSWIFVLIYNIYMNNAFRFKHVTRYLLTSQANSSGEALRWEIKPTITPPTVTYRSYGKETWRIPLHKDMWIDFSHSESVTKPSNDSLVLGKNFTSNTTPQKTILMYTPFFGQKPWKLIAEPSWDGRATDWKGRKYCPHSCKLTYDHKEINNSDAIVFHGRDMPKPEHLGKLLRTKRPFQRWVFFNRENPVNTYTSFFPLRGMFNWTSTYRLDSDIFMPDHYIHPLQNEATPPERNYAEGKDRLVSWAVSNCQYRYIRNRIASKLLKHIPIDIYGSCQRGFDQWGHKCEPFTDECLRTLKRYKFYLAFENFNCYHYVTEKYWENALMNDIVPIVMGGAVLEDKLVVPRTYINILDFPNAETLAHYLKYLDSNDTAYNEYFWYKKYYKIFKPQFICRLCKKLHDETEKPKVYNNLFTLYNRRTNCHINDTYIRTVWLRDRESRRRHNRAKKTIYDY